MRRPIPKDEHERRLALYNQGMNDREIAEALHYDIHTIFKWREKYSLPSLQPKGNWAKDQRMQLYRDGLTDAEIAKRLHLTNTAISSWRKRHGLKMVERARLRLEEAENAKRMELYKKGLNDREIADECFTDAGNIFSWRNARGLPANRPSTKMENGDERMALYMAGMNDKQIAEAQGVRPPAIRCWRLARNLPPNWRKDMEDE